MALLFIKNDAHTRIVRYIWKMSATHTLPPNNLPFAWDRIETAESLKEKLADETGSQWIPAAAWLMREARIQQVWPFLTLQQIDQHFLKLRPLLGRQTELWEYILRVARELGKL